MLEIALDLFMRNRAKQTTLVKVFKHFSWELFFCKRMNFVWLCRSLNGIGKRTLPTTISSFQIVFQQNCTCQILPDIRWTFIKFTKIQICGLKKYIEVGKGSSFLHSISPSMHGWNVKENGFYYYLLFSSSYLFLKAYKSTFSVTSQWQENSGKWRNEPYPHP